MIDVDRRIPVGQFKPSFARRTSSSRSSHYRVHDSVDTQVAALLRRTTRPWRTAASGRPVPGRSACWHPASRSRRTSPCRLIEVRIGPGCASHAWRREGLECKVPHNDKHQGNNGRDYRLAYAGLQLHTP